MPHTTHTHIRQNTQAIGNNAANAVLEARLLNMPSNLLKSFKPNPKSSVDERKLFIVKKYDMREFVIKENRKVHLGEFYEDED